MATCGPPRAPVRSSARSPSTTPQTASSRGPGTPRRGRNCPGARRGCPGRPVAAHRGYSAMGAPFEAAGVRVTAQAHRLLGDPGAAAAEFDEAAATYEQLGAALQLRLLAGVRRSPLVAGGLTAREVEVLARIAEGGTNKEVAAACNQREDSFPPSGQHLSQVGCELTNCSNELGVPARTHPSRGRRLSAPAASNAPCQRGRSHDLPDAADVDLPSVISTGTSARPEQEGPA